MLQEPQPQICVRPVHRPDCHVLGCGALALPRVYGVHFFQELWRRRAKYIERHQVESCPAGEDKKQRDFLVPRKGQLKR